METYLKQDAFFSQDEFLKQANIDYDTLREYVEKSGILRVIDENNNELFPKFYIQNGRLNRGLLHVSQVFFNVKDQYKIIEWFNEYDSILETTPLAYFLDEGLDTKLDMVASMKALTVDL